MSLRQESAPRSIAYEADARSGDVAWLSPLAEGFLGYPAERWRAGPRAWLRDFVHLEDRPAVAGWVEGLAGGAAAEGEREYRMLAADGRIAHVHDRRSLVDGRRLLGFLCDVTERREAAERLDAIIAHTPNVAIEGYDAAGRVLWWNRAAERLFGWSEAEALGKTLDRLMLDAAGAAEFLGVIRGIERTGKPFGPSEWLCRRRDGTERTVYSTIFAIPAGGGSGECVFVCMDVDVTERKRAEEALRRSEEQLRQAQKMEAIGRLAGGVAHDFNNMLFAIAGHADHLVRRLPEGDRLGRNAVEIKKAAERAANLTGQLLAFSRKQVVAPRVLDLNAVVAGIGPMLRSLIGEHIEIATDLDPALARVSADPGQVDQVILNLCVNARDAMEEGGRLTIATRNVRVPGAGEGEGYVELAVRDTGTGMTPEVQAHLFEPFFTTKEQGKGTGLGLSTVYGNVGRSGGHTPVESAPGRGSEFRVRLPAGGSAAAAAAEASAPTPPGGTPVPSAAGVPAAGAGETVLLVEDEVLVRQLTREVLEGYGFRVLEAASGAEALALREANGPPDIVVTDVVMPRMGGRELVERLTGRQPGLRAIFLSGYTDDAIGREGVLDPGTLFLQKPFPPDALARLVRDALDAPAPPPIRSPESRAP